MRAANSPLEAKSDVSNSTYTCYVTWLTQVVKRAQDHLELATKARSYYRAQIAASKEGLNAIFGCDCLCSLLIICEHSRRMPL